MFLDSDTNTNECDPSFHPYRITFATMYWKIFAFARTADKILCRRHRRLKMCDVSRTALRAVHVFFVFFFFFASPTSAAQDFHVFFFRCSQLLLKISLRLSRRWRWRDATRQMTILWLRASRRRRCESVQTCFSQSFWYSALIMREYGWHGSTVKKHTRSPGSQIVLLWYSALNFMIS